MSGVRVLTSAAELAEATGHHPVAVLDVGSGFVGTGVRRGLARRRCRRLPPPLRPRGAGVGGPRHGIRPGALLDDPAVRAWVTGGGNRHLSVPRGLMPVVARAARPRQPRRRVGLDVDPRRSPGGAPARSASSCSTRPTATRRRRSSTAHSPRTHGQPFARPGQRWVGGARPDAPARSSPSAAASRARPGTPTLAGIAVDRRPARRGLGRRGHRPPDPAGGRRDRRLRPGHVRRQRRRPAALPPAGLHDRDGVDHTLVRRLTCA